jgi:hypothetical protein
MIGTTRPTGIRPNQGKKSEDDDEDDDDSPQSDSVKVGQT